MSDQNLVCRVLCFFHIFRQAEEGKKLYEKRHKERKHVWRRIDKEWQKEGKKKESTIKGCLCGFRFLLNVKSAK